MPLTDDALLSCPLCCAILCRRTTRLFVRMVNEQPWVGAALHGCGGFDWELGRRSGSVGRLLQEYSEYTPALLEGLLQVGAPAISPLSPPVGMKAAQRWQWLSTG